MNEPEWWYCLRHNRAEKDFDVPLAERMGPYPDQASAARALQSAEERTEAWDKDPRWRED